MELTTIKYPMGCLRSSPRLVLDESKAQAKAEGEQRPGIRVVTGLTRLVQKALGYAEEMKVGDRQITINKRSRNKWIARTSGYKNDLTDEQHAVISEAIRTRTQMANHTQKDILLNHHKAYNLKRQDVKAFNCDYQNVEAVQHLFQMQASTRAKEKKSQSDLALNIYRKIDSAVKGSSSGLVLVQEQEDFANYLNNCDLSVIEKLNERIPLPFLRSTALSDSPLYFDQPTWLEASRLSCQFGLGELELIKPLVALQRAIKKNNLTSERLQFLLGRGADINKIKIDGLSPVHYAIRHKNVEMLELFANHGADLHTPSAFEYTPLVLAVHSRNCEMVKVLLAHGCDVDSKYKDQTLLHLAVTNGDQKMVRFLVEKNANLSLQDQFKSTAVHYAAQYGLREKMPSFEKMRLDLLSELVKDKPALNTPNLMGNTPLHLAIDRYDVKVVKMLIENGADLSLKDKNEFSPLLRAVYLPRRLDGKRGCREEIVKLLAKDQAALNQQNEVGNTPLHLAICHLDLTMIKELLKCGADINIQNAHGNTALHIAVNQCNLNMVALLINQGADANMQDINGKTALEIAKELPPYNRNLKGIINILSNSAQS